MALFDSAMRVCDETESNVYGYIIGVAIRSSIFSEKDEYSCFRFNTELNCVIGSRGTGKTTLLEIIQSIIMPNSLKGKDRNKVLDKFTSAVVYLKNGDDIFAISYEPKFIKDKYTNKKTEKSLPKIYLKKESESEFKTAHRNLEFLKTFLTAGYQQRQLFDYSRNPNKILEIVDDFINWKNTKKYQDIIKQIEHQTSQLKELIDISYKERDKIGRTFINHIKDEDLTKKVIQKLKIINLRKKDLFSMRKEMIDELNEVLRGKVRLVLKRDCYNIYEQDDIKSLSSRVARKAGKYYEYEVHIRNILKKIYEINSLVADTFDFYIWLLEGDYNKIIENYNLQDLTVLDLQNIRESLVEEDILVFLEDKLSLKYNINSGTSYKENFKDNQQLSMGQNAVALLLLILNASYALNDNRPLLMDQPEDDLDNSYIYSTLVKEFRNSKQKRQIIISTHNPNVPVAADAENIMVLKYNGKHSYIDSNGAIDSNKTAKAILEIMEGGQEAIKRRMDKYNLM